MDSYSAKRPRFGEFEPSEDPNEVRIPQQFVGWLKGKNGQQIQDIEVRTGAQISIDQTTKDLGYSRVVLLGNVEAVQAAHETISHELRRVMDRDGVSEVLTIQPGEHYEETQIPQKYVGWLKGSGGAQLRDMESRSGARVRVDQSTRDSGFSVAQITGSMEAVRHCRSLIEGEISRVQERDRVIAEHSSRQSGISIGMSGFNEVQIPQQYVGWIKGSGGGQIKAIEQRTGATITIDQSMKDLGYSKAVICGTDDAVRAAKEFIESELARVFERDGIREAPRGFQQQPPSQSQPAHGLADSEAAKGLLGVVGLLLAAAAPQHNPQRGQGGGVADALAPLLGALANSSGSSSPPPAQGSSGGCGGGPAFGNSGFSNAGASGEEIVRIPNDSVGWLKGRQGAMIRDIESRSGAQVDIDQSTRDQGYSVALIRGLPHQRRIGSGLVIAEVCKAMDSSREPLDGSFPGTKQEFQIDPSHVGWVKGPRGKVVQEIQIKSGTRIDVDQNAQRGYALVKVFGTRDGTDHAKQLIARELHKISPEAANAIVADLPGGMDYRPPYDDQQHGFAQSAPPPQAFGSSQPPPGHSFGGCGGGGGGSGCSSGSLAGGAGTGALLGQLGALLQGAPSQPALQPPMQQQGLGQALGLPAQQVQPHQPQQSIAAPQHQGQSFPQAGFGDFSPAPVAGSLPALASPAMAAPQAPDPEAAKQQLVNALQQLADAVAQQGQSATYPCN